MKRGFTLIELLIVMAILGVLAVVVLVAINPAEQMKRARDAGRVSGVQQIGRAVTAYYTANGFLPAEATWGADLTASQELSAIPADITAAGESTTCANGNMAGGATWCYVAEGGGGSAGTGTGFTVSARLWSKQRDEQCEAITAGGNPWSIFSSVASRGGLYCGSANIDFGTTPSI